MTAFSCFMVLTPIVNNRDNQINWNFNSKICNEVPQPISSDVVVLDYNEYYPLYTVDSIGSDYKIEWSFSSSNSLVGISVYMMNDYNYEEWRNGRPASKFILSDGSETVDSGKFYMPYTDVWYIVFYNNDPNMQSSTVTIFADEIYMGWINVYTPSDWETGDSVSITWSYYNTEAVDPNPNVKIELFRGTTLAETISSYTPNDESYSWTVPTDIYLASNYKIRISSINEPIHVTDDSNYFEISPTFNPIWIIFIVIGAVGAIVGISLVIRRSKKKKEKDSPSKSMDTHLESQKRKNQKYERKKAAAEQKFEIVTHTYDKNGIYMGSNRDSLTGKQLDCMCWVFGIVIIVCIIALVLISL